MEEFKSELDESLMVERIDPELLDYSVLNGHVAMLTQVAKVANSGITIFDHHLCRHVFASGNLSVLFNYDADRIECEDISYFESNIHPDDVKILNRNGSAVMRYLMDGDRDTLLCTKLISEYRILIDGKYTRVIEQFRVLELDPNGNIWLVMSVLDISPNQTLLNVVHSKLMNCDTGELYLLPEFTDLSESTSLSQREKMVLQLVRDGKLSKEISDQLEISIFTVNTHRQRILKKLNANNAAEAILYASRLGLLD